MNTGKQKWSRIYKLAFKLNLDEFIEAMNTESPAMSPKPQEEITDTMIEKEFPIKSETTVLTFGYIQANTNKRIGAKWLRSQMTANRREELIKFANYKDTLAKTYSLTENQLVVDKYLKII